MTSHGPATIDRWVAALVVTYTAALIVFGYVVHTEPADVSAECDGYIAAAREFVRGSIPREVFRPLLYPALVALVSWLPAIDIFEAGRLVSNVAVGVTAWCTYRIGVVAFGSHSTGGAAAALFALHPLVMVQGVMAATDSTFVAFCAATLLALARCVRPDESSQLTASRGRLFRCGVCVGLAWSTRYPGIALVVPVFAALVFASGLRSGARQFAWVTGGAALAALPQWIANFIVFGNPVYSETWRNLAVKLDGRKDFQMLFDPSTEGFGWWSLAASDPGRVLDGAISQFGIGLTNTLPRAVAIGWVGPILSVLAVLAVGVVLVSKGRDHNRRTLRAYVGALVVFVLTYLTLVSVTFYAMVRLMLPLAPAVLVVGTHALLSIVPRWFGAARVGSVVRVVLLGASLVVAGMMPWIGSAMLERFANNRSPGVFAAARWIEANGEPDAVVIGDHPHLAYYFPFRYIHDVHGAKRAVGDEEYLRLLEHVATHSGIDYLLFSSKFVEPRPRVLVDGPAPPFLREVFRADGAVLYSVRPM